MVAFVIAVRARMLFACCLPTSAVELIQLSLILGELIAALVEKIYVNEHKRPMKSNIIDYRYHVYRVIGSAGRVTITT